MTKIPSDKWTDNKAILQSVKSGDQVEVSTLREEAQVRSSLPDGLSTFKSGDRKWKWIFRRTK